MGRAGIAAMLVFASLLLLPGAIAHAPGAGLTHLEGSRILAPSGTFGNTALLDLSDLGAVKAGDQLRYFWKANEGLGPSVRFEILRLAVMPGSTLEAVYGVMDTTQTETWMIPSSAEYMASWENPNGETVVITYVFEVLLPLAAPLALDWPLVLGLGVAGGVFAFLFFWNGRRKGPKAVSSEAGEETGPPEE